LPRFRVLSKLLNATYASLNKWQRWAENFLLSWGGQDKALYQVGATPGNCTFQTSVYVGVEEIPAQHTRSGKENWRPSLLPVVVWEARRYGEGA
jgi:hypothetical protein